MFHIYYDNVTLLWKNRIDSKIYQTVYLEIKMVSFILLDIRNLILIFKALFYYIFIMKTRDFVINCVYYFVTAIWCDGAYGEMLIWFQCDEKHTIMLKWFAVPNRGGGETPPREVVTDDPLATIALSLPRIPGRRHSSSRRPKHGVRKRPREIYAVSRWVLLKYYRIKYSSPWRFCAILTRYESATWENFDMTIILILIMVTIL